MPALCLVFAAVVAAALCVSAARSDIPGRLACPLSGRAACHEAGCPLRAVEDCARSLVSLATARGAEDAPELR